jgi:hypothetical protein
MGLYPFYIVVSMTSTTVTLDLALAALGSASAGSVPNQHER